MVVWVAAWRESGGQKPIAKEETRSLLYQCNTEQGSGMKEKEGNI